MTEILGKLFAGTGADTFFNSPAAGIAQTALLGEAAGADAAGAGAGANAAPAAAGAGSSFLGSTLKGYENFMNSEGMKTYSALERIKNLVGGTAGQVMMQSPSGGVVMAPRRQVRRMF